MSVCNVISVNFVQPTKISASIKLYISKQASSYALLKTQ